MKIRPILICNGKTFPIAQATFSDNPDLEEAINDFVSKHNLKPIYIDRNVAIFKKYWSAAFFKEDLNKAK